MIFPNVFLRSIIGFYFFKNQLFSKYVIMESLSPQEENIIKDKINLFRPKKDQNHTVVKFIRNLFRLKKEIKGIKDTVLRNIKNIFEYEKEEENYYKPVREDNF